MRYTLALPFLAIGALAATPVRRVPDMVRRDLATITSVVANIASKIEAFDTAVKGFSGDAASIQTATDGVLQATKDGVTAISATSEITLTDALQLQALITDLTTKTDNAVNDAIAKKDAFVAAGLGAAVEQGFVDQKAAASSLAETITSKVPEAVRELAATLSQGIQDSLQKGIDAFKGTGGPASSAPASSTPAESTPAESTPAESTPAESTPAESTPASSTPAESTPVESTPAGYPSSTPVYTPGPTGYSTKTVGPSSGLPTYSSPTLSSTPPPYTGAAMPTAAAGYGAAALAALVAAAAL